MSEKLSSGLKARSKVHSFDDLFNTSTDMGFGHSVQNEKYHVENIHETLIVPMDAGLDRQALENMVQEVNATQVAPQDRLSDHVYHYDAVDHELMRADKAEQKNNAREDKMLSVVADKEEKARSSLKDKLVRKKEEVGVKPQKEAPDLDKKKDKNMSM